MFVEDGPVLWLSPIATTIRQAMDSFEGDRSVVTIGKNEGENNCQDRQVFYDQARPWG